MAPNLPRETPEGAARTAAAVVAARASVGVAAAEQAERAGATALAAAEQTLVRRREELCVVHPSRAGTLADGVRFHAALRAARNTAREAWVLARAECATRRASVAAA